MSRVSGDILDVAVIGAGGVGLGVSYFLKRAGLDHLVLERSRIGDTWLRQRWDSFHLNSPNVRSMLPGDAYEGTEPLGAMTHHEFVAYLNAYVDRNGLPVRLNSDVQRLTRDNDCFLSLRQRVIDWIHVETRFSRARGKRYAIGDALVVDAVGGGTA